mmetsp:Transcript_109747/g.190126  ORF Transcript_109747/g.190126 Transcript_109747/m.190126 type:complete len:142 (-) Transcript_109747:500-925(-)
MNGSRRCFQSCWAIEGCGIQTSPAKLHLGVMTSLSECCCDYSSILREDDGGTASVTMQSWTRAAQYVVHMPCHKIFSPLRLFWDKQTSTTRYVCERVYKQGKACIDGRNVCTESTWCILYPLNSPCYPTLPSTRQAWLCIP